MKRAIFLSFGIAVLMLFAQSQAFACECAIVGNPTIEQEVKNYLAQSVVVFRGEVSRIEPRADGHSFNVKFNVAEYWKGTSGAELTLVIRDSSCDYPFEAGEKYLVYAYIREDLLTTNDCLGNSKVANASEELKVLGKGEPPIKNDLHAPMPNCPLIDIVPGVENESQSIWHYSVRLKNVDPKLKLTYQWTVLYGDQKGEIRSGQGSDAITIDKGSLYDGVTVGVKIGGLETGCHNEWYLTSTN